MTQRLRRATAQAALAILGALLLLVGPNAAQAALASDVAMVWSQQTATATYGTEWDTTLSMQGVYCSGFVDSRCVVTVAYSGPQRGSFTIDAYDSRSETPSHATAILYSGLVANGAPLPAGTYRFSASFSALGSTGSTTSDFVLTIAPAKVGTDLRTALDPQNSRNAVVTALLTGDYVSSIGGQANGPAMPAGTWHVIVKDSSGVSVLSRDVPKDAGAAPNVNVYWTGVSSQSYSVSAAFEPASAAAGNFEITGAENSKFVPAAAPTPSPTRTSSALAVAPVHASAPTAPAWAVGLVGLIVVLLAVAIIVVSLRIHRPTAQPDEIPEEAPDATL